MNKFQQIGSIILCGTVISSFAIGCQRSPNQPAGAPTPSILTDPETLQPLPTPPSDGLFVIATTNIVGDVIANIGGEWIDLQVLIPAGSDPHAYEPAPGDLSAIAEADVVFINGFGLEESMMDLLANATGPIISLSEGLEGRNFSAEELGRISAEDEIQVGQLDPHVWFDPQSIEYWVVRIRETFGRLDPEHARSYTGNSVNYLDLLRELDGWIEGTIADLPKDKRLLVTDHLVFGYFADKYGFEMVGAIVPAPSTLAEPSARDLAKLEDQIIALGVKAVFIGSATNPSLARSITADTGAQMIQMYTGSLGPPGTSADNYVGFMRYNVTAIVDSLKD
jgi:manganese/iron transport system substrate-binding protein